jgi:hypothetical protein
MKELLKVIGVRYFDTRRGLGYECKTNKLNVVIWNDGQGGGTFIAPHHPYTKDYENKMDNEEYLENLINEFEEIPKKNVIAGVDFSDSLSKLKQL